MSDSYDETWKHYYDKFRDEEEFQRILDSIFMDQIKYERYNVFFCLTDNIHGRECTIFVSMYLTCLKYYEDTNLENNYKIQDDNVDEISDYEKYERYIDKYYEQTLDLCEEMEAFQWVLAGADALE